MAGKSDYLENAILKLLFNATSGRFCCRRQWVDVQHVLRVAYRRSARFRNANIERGADIGLRHLYPRGGCSNERRIHGHGEQRFSRLRQSLSRQPVPLARVHGNAFLDRGTAHRRGKIFYAGTITPIS